MSATARPAVINSANNPALTFGQARATHVCVPLTVTRNNREKTGGRRRQKPNARIRESKTDFRPVAEARLRRCPPESALAGGCGLATACDLVLATDDARFGYPEVKIGFVPAMMMAILRRNVSEKRAFALATQGFDFDAATAKDFGLINEIFAADEFRGKVKDYVEAYKPVSRSAVVLSKRLLYQMDRLNYEAALASGIDVNTIARLTHDCKAGVDKFLNK